MLCKKFVFAALAVGTAWGVEPAWREVRSFSAVTNTGLGYSLYVVGNQPELGMWQPTGAVRLVWTPGNVWTGRAALRAGATVEVQYIRRRDTNTQHCVNTNVLWPGVPNTTSMIAAPPAAPYAGKTLLYHSSWTSATVLFSMDGTNFFDAPMDRIGEGRFPGEYLHRAAGFGAAGLPVQFVCYGYLGGTQYWDNAPYPGYGAGDYYTPLDVFFLQDGQVYNYFPPPAPSPPIILTQFVASSYSGISSRNVRIYLPRGYTNNAWRRYPVLYMHDGQNVFDPGGAFGSWSADASLTREISQGRMREAIVLGVNNTDNRLSEYCPPGDFVLGNPGIGDAYANYLIHNVRPAIDTAYRTLNDRPNTLTMGSSMGGLISSWLAFRTNVFGKAGVLSPSFWTASNFVGWIASNETKGARIYLDGGTAEPFLSLWNPLWQVRGYLMADGYAEFDDLLTVIGCGHAHNEAAWKDRTPRALQFLLNLWDEPNLLAQQEYPPRVEWTASTPTGLTHRALGGFQYRLETTTSPVTAAWNPIQTSATHALPWSDQNWSITNISMGENVLHLRSAALAQ